MTPLTIASDPVMVDNARYQLTRLLRSPGEITVNSGDQVNPDTPIGVAANNTGRSITLPLARELGVAPDSVTRYLTKPIGSRFEAGESVARSRKGLRNVTADAPIAGRLQEVNTSSGTATFVAETGEQQLMAVVHGEVREVLPNWGATIQVVGARVRGAVAFGPETFGPLKVAVDRNDRELTSDAVPPDVRGAIVLAGMTMGSVAIRRLAEAGARAIVVGSIAEGEVRRAAAASGSERSAGAFWQAIPSNSSIGVDIDHLPLTVFVTEGFGRRPMAAPLFDFLREREGMQASLVSAQNRDGYTFPQMYFSEQTAVGEQAVKLVAPADGVQARLVDPQYLGTVVTCRSEAFLRYGDDGQPHLAVDVELHNGSRRLVRLANLEVLSSN